jgi:phenylpropionate dioxygenase-like ring-hydroxylating dioxygenase large terminal subunit
METVSSTVAYENLIKDDRVHGSLYTDPVIFEDELKKIWYRQWVYVAHESEIREPGDYVTKTIGLQQIIATRDEDGEIHLLHNRCSHRGNTIVASERGNANFFRCQYHGWTFKNNGDLTGAPYRSGFDKAFNKHQHGMGKVPRVTSYGGFVFGSLSESGIDLHEHLGEKAREAIDNLLALSPEGEIELSAGWLKHRIKANWKMMVENEVDGYHPKFVHQSLFKVASSQITDVASDKASSVVRDLGQGHTELDFRPEYRQMGKKLAWCGAGEESLPDYVKAMEERYGKEKAHELLVDGPPHVMIFPNLFIGEIDLFVIQPMAANETVQYQTPLFFKGAPDLNRRLLRQAEATIGPAGLLLADDAEMFERNQRGVQERSPEWLVLCRGLERERVDEDGCTIGNITDETGQRAIWRHYREFMTKD